MDTIRRDINYRKYFEFKTKYPKIKTLPGHELLINMCVKNHLVANQIVKSDYYLDKQSEPDELARNTYKRNHHFIVFNLDLKRRKVATPTQDIEMEDDDSKFLVDVKKSNHLNLFWNEMLRSARLIDYDLYD